MEPVFRSLFIAPYSLLVCAPMTNQAFLWREMGAGFSTWLSVLTHACINLRNAFHHYAQRTNQRVILSIESDGQPVFLVSLPGLLQKASKSLVTAPAHYFFESFRNHQCPFWNHCFNKQQIMRRRLQNKRASQLRPLNSGRKRQGLLWGTRSQRPIAHSLRECGLSIFTAFDMPWFSNPCRDSKYHRYDFEFLEQSPVNNKQINDTSLSMRHSIRRKTRM